MKYLQAAASFPVVVTPIFVLLYLVAVIDLAIQDDDDALPANRYVNSQTGFDNSTCNNVSHPCKTIAYAIKQCERSDVVAAAGTFVLSESVELRDNITLQALYPKTPPLLKCGLMNKVLSP
jgi:hypothetical protein